MRPIAIFVAVGLAGCGWWIYSIHEAEKQRTIEAEAELAAAALPEGAQAQWNDFLAQRIRERVRVSDAGIEIPGRSVNGHLLLGPSYFSRNHPYHVGCDVYSGISVNFGGGDDVESIDLVGFLKDPGSPPFGVPYRSAAAEDLLKTLCRQAADQVAAVIAAAPGLSEKSQ